jgi:hypothetical protein
MGLGLIPLAVGHPLIHLGYAFEMDSKELAMEALGLASIGYGMFHKYLDNPAYTKPSKRHPRTPLDLLKELTEDKRLDEAPLDPTIDDMEHVLEQHEQVILEYWNAWEIDDATKQFQLSQEAAVALVIATVRPGTHSYNFIMLHLLTTSHAVRILLPFFPEQHHVTLVREWWLMAITVYIAKGRPKIDPDNLEQDLKGKHWTYVEDKGLHSEWSTDAHYVKGK